MWKFFYFILESIKSWLKSNEWTSSKPQCPSTLYSESLVSLRQESRVSLSMCEIPWLMRNVLVIRSSSAGVFRAYFSHHITFLKHFSFFHKINFYKTNLFCKMCLSFAADLTAKVHHCKKSLSPFIYNSTKISIWL